MVVAHIFRAIAVSGDIVENLAKIFVPTAIHHWAVGENQCALEAHFFHHLQRRERFAEAHLSIPQHFFRLFELLFGFVDGFALLGAEYDGIVGGGHLASGERLAVSLHRSDGALHGFEVANKPFVGSVHGVEHFLFHARAFEHGVHFLVVERT